jgi:hypothetical protein
VRISQFYRDERRNRDKRHSGLGIMIYVLKSSPVYQFGSL